MVRTNPERQTNLRMHQNTPSAIVTTISLTTIRLDKEQKSTC